MKRLSALIGLIGVLSPVIIFAQTNISSPTMIMSWQASSYIPSGYPGKILPPRDSVVDVYLEFTDAGVVVPLNTHIIRWSVAGSFFAGGAGLNHIQFPLNRFTTKSYPITAVIKDYKGADIEKTVIINRADPFVTLRVIASEKVAGGTQVSFRASPFFFSSLNPNDYMFNWTVNRVRVSSRAETLTALLQGEETGQRASVKVTTTNLNNEIESADAERQFIINN